jgi:hypothetical protein
MIARDYTNPGPLLATEHSDSYAIPVGGDPLAR